MAGLLANQMTGWLAAHSVRLVPGSDVAWEVPAEEPLFRDWVDRAGDALRTRVGSWVVQLPIDRRRRRFSLLLLDLGRWPVGFAKFTGNPANPLAVRALARFADQPTRAFWSPQLALAGRLGDYSFVLTSPMPNRPHCPAVLTPQHRRQILGEIQAPS